MPEAISTTPHVRTDCAAKVNLGSHKKPRCIASKTLKTSPDIASRHAAWEASAAAFP
jgi:hypothetical protein